jgi:hypothetical protein
MTNYNDPSGPLPFLSPAYWLIRHKTLALTLNSILSGVDGYFKEGKVMDHMTSLIRDGITFDSQDERVIGRWDRRDKYIEEPKFPVSDEMFYAWVGEQWRTNQHPHLVFYTKAEFKELFEDACRNYVDSEKIFYYCNNERDRSREFSTALSVNGMSLETSKSLVDYRPKSDYYAHSEILNLIYSKPNYVLNKDDERAIKSVFGFIEKINVDLKNKQFCKEIEEKFNYVLAIIAMLGDIGDVGEKAKICTKKARELFFLNDKSRSIEQMYLALKIIKSANSSLSLREYLSTGLSNNGEISGAHNDAAFKERLVAIDGQIIGPPKEIYPGIFEYEYNSSYRLIRNFPPLKKTTYDNRYSDSEILEMSKQASSQVWVDIQLGRINFGVTNLKVNITINEVPFIVNVVKNLSSKTIEYFSFPGKLNNE